MCYISDGKIERCHNCSENDFASFLRVIQNIEPARPTHHIAARTAQKPLNQGYPQSSRRDVHTDQHKKSTAEHLLDREQDLTHQAQPSSSRYDAGTAQHKRQRTNADQPSSLRHDATINGNTKHKREKTNADQYSPSIQNARVDGLAQQAQQEKNAVQACSSRQSARTAGTARNGQQEKHQETSSPSIHSARSDWTNGRGRKESHQDSKSSSKNHTITDLTGDDEQQGTSGETSQDHPRVEDMDVLTTDTNKLPPPSWEDERVILPLVEQQLQQDEYFEHQKRKLDEIWAMYRKEREVLAACYTPQPEEIWTPAFEEEILKQEIPLEEEIWTRSMLEGEAWMRNILEEIEAWPQKPPEEADIWTRKDSGMLSAAVLRQIWRVFTLQASLEEEELERPDENNTTLPTWRMEEGDEVTHTFSEVLTSAAYPPLASQAQD